MSDSTESIQLPPLSDDLGRRLAGMRPVRMRRPVLTVFFTAALALLWLVAVEGWMRGHAMPGQRSMAPSLSTHMTLPWIALAILWLVGFVAPLGAALLPVRNQVLPDHRRATRWAWFGVALVLASGALVGLAIPDPITGSPLPALWGCLRVGLLVSAVPFLLGVMAVRRVALVGRTALGAALGAAAGAVGALILHCECSVGGPLHLALAHGGATVIWALVGLALGALLSHEK